ncbi:TRAP transporter substrate-binding protein DctP [Azospirillum melinis]
MKRFLALAVLSLCLLPAAAKADPVQLKFAVFAPDTELTWQAAIKPFIEAVNEEAKDTIRIVGYPNGALGRNLAQQSQMVLDGVADFAFVIPGLTPGRFADNGLVELPGIFRDAKDSTLAYNTLVQTGKMRGYERYYVVAALGTIPSSIHTRQQIGSLDDLRDKKIRSVNAMEAKSIKAIGAAPILMPVNEAGEAIARGTIDGTAMQPVPLVDFGLSRITTSHYVANIGVSPLAILMNKEKFESLPISAQEAIRKYSGAWFTDRYIAALTKQTDKVMDGFAADPKHKVIRPSASDQQRLDTVYRQVADQWASESPHNAELLALLRAEVAKARALN